MTRALFLAALFATTAQAVQLRQQDALDHGDSPNIGSRPGSPNPPRMPKGAKWPYNTHNEKREAWGDRLVKAAQATATEKECGGFVSFGDFTWCAKAMPKETPESMEFLEPYGPVLTVTDPSLQALVQNLPSGDEFVGLTFGIRERDMWSELMSNRYRVPTVLYDCFFTAPRGPMAFSNLTAKAKGLESCPSWRKDLCYGAPYEAKKLCAGTAARRDSRSGLQFEPMSKILAGRAPLSTHMKMDIEGSEWAVLEELLESSTDMEKIRTLDMEVHFQLTSGVTTPKQNTKDMEVDMERQVSIMERLSKHFAITGSTIQSTHEAMAKRVQNGWPMSPLEPAIYTTNGFALETYTIDLVNKKLL